MPNRFERCVLSFESSSGFIIVTEDVDYVTIEIDETRLRRDIENVGQIGEVASSSGQGRTVLTGTDEDKQVRNYFIKRAREAGLDIRIDPVGNIAGRWVPPEACRDDAPIVTGSHLDSVINGGIFDGPLGVFAGLEAVRSLQESDRQLSHPVEVVSWTEEEGVRFGTGLLGSSVAANHRSLEDAVALEDEDGLTLGDELRRIGFRGNERIDPSSWNAWLELHIEQGTKLSSGRSRVGIVESIAGIANCEVTFEGKADHAGGTPMFQRQDALAAASEFIVETERTAKNMTTSGNESAVATIGSVTVSPNANNVIPGTVELVMDIRDADLTGIQEMINQSRRNANHIAEHREVDVSFDQYRLTEPKQLSDRCIDAAGSAAEQCDIEIDEMTSAALHDTANVSTATDAVLLFAPSKGGISHHPDEWTDRDDCAAATRVLATTISKLSNK